MRIKYERYYSLEHELDYNKKDKLNRFNYNYLNNKNKKLFLTPFNSENYINKFKYPNQKKACVVLTHDVDLPFHIFLIWVKLIFKDIKIKRYKNAFKRFIGYINKKKDIWKNFEYIMNLEEKYGAKSSFYFMATEDKYKLYDIKNLKKDIKNIKNRGFEVGLHGGYDSSWYDFNVLLKEKLKLEKYLGCKIVGIRQHYLRYDYKKTLLNDKKAGFLYDTTLGYNDHIGFRNGMGHIYNPINLNTGKRIKNFYEIPLVIMDCSLWYYMNLDFNLAWKEIKKIIDKVIKIKGTISILWHNDQFDNTLHPRSGELYEKILKYLYDNNIWMTSGEMCIKYLKKTNQI